MDLLKMHKRRSRVSETVYIALNIGLAVAMYVIVSTSQSPWLALLVLLVSKWRVLAVRPRFWFANLVANMVDIIVGASVVVLLASSQGHTITQLLITGLYIVWLLIIKPRSRRSYVAFQAAVAVFVGITSLSILSYAWDAVFFVLCMWVIGYVVARHVLGSYEEVHTTLYSMVMGFAFAELGWIGFHWLMAYPIPSSGSIQFSQLALFVVLLCFIAERAYASYHKHGSVRRDDVLPSIILTGSIMITVYIFALLFGANAL